jgi:hypothetical protein
MWNLTEPMANSLFAASNLILILGAAAVLLGTIGAIAMGGAKEHFANERISANEAETEQARANAAIANEKAESERVERLKLELRLAPRSLSQDDANRLATALAALKGIAVDVIAYEAIGNDVAPLSHQIIAALVASGMNAKLFTPMGGAGFFTGILVRCSEDAPVSVKKAIAPLAAALNAATLDATEWKPYPPNEPPAGAYNGPGQAEAKLRVLIGAKP